MSSFRNVNKSKINSNQMKRRINPRNPIDFPLNNQPNKNEKDISDNDYFLYHKSQSSIHLRYDRVRYPH